MSTKPPLSPRAPGRVHAVHVQAALTRCDVAGRQSPLSGLPVAPVAARFSVSAAQAKLPVTVRPPAPHVQKAMVAAQRKIAPPAGRPAHPGSVPAASGIALQTRSAGTSPGRPHTTPPSPPRPGFRGVIQRKIILLYERGAGGSMSDQQEKEYKETLEGAGRLAAAKERGSILEPAAVGAQEKPLKDLTEPLYLMGHGDVGQQTLGGKDASAILALLEGLGLSGYKGNKIFLAGCQTASAPTGLSHWFSGTTSLVDQLKQRLAMKYQHISVTGSPGLMIIDSQGVIRSVNADQESGFDRAMKDLIARKKKLQVTESQAAEEENKIYSLHTQEIERFSPERKADLKEVKAEAPATLPPFVDPGSQGHAQLRGEYSQLFWAKRLKAKPGVSLADPATYKLGPQFNRFLARVDLGLVTILPHNDPGRPAPGSSGFAPHVQAAVARTAAPTGRPAWATPVPARPAVPVFQMKPAAWNARPVPAAVPYKVVQPMILALGDLAEATNQRLTLSAGERSSREAISDAVTKRIRSTGEARVNPWDTKNIFAKGALHRIGPIEPLRIYGHGQGPPDRIVSVGGYTVKALVQKLIDLGLPQNYAGEIYLTGCEAAIGPDYGFLGELYQSLRRHCPNVKVRGNLGRAVTFADGTQGIWSGRVSEHTYNSARSALNAEKSGILGEIDRTKLHVENRRRRRRAYEAQRAQLVREVERTPEDDPDPDLMKHFLFRDTQLTHRDKQLARSGKRLDRELQRLLDLLRKVDARIVELDRLAYTSELNPDHRSVTLPLAREVKSPPPSASSISSPLATPELKRAPQPPPAPASAVAHEAKEDPTKKAQQDHYSDLFKAGRLVRTVRSITLVDPAEYSIQTGQFDRFLARVTAGLIVVRP